MFKTGRSFLDVHPNLCALIFQNYSALVVSSNLPLTSSTLPPRHVLALVILVCAIFIVYYSISPASPAQSVRRDVNFAHKRDTNHEVASIERSRNDRHVCFHGTLNTSGRSSFVMVERYTKELIADAVCRKAKGDSRDRRREINTSWTISGGTFARNTGCQTGKRNRAFIYCLTLSCDSNKT